MNHLLNTFLGLIMVLVGLVIAETGTYGKADQFPVPPFAGWLVVGVGIALLVYELWWFLRRHKNKDEHESE